jgi:DNA phosphorothioation-dependent restriction protein DptH
MDAPRKRSLIKSMRYDKPDFDTSLANSTYDIQQSAPEGVRIRLGTQKGGTTPVYWNPEDPRQLASPNIAVVGGEDTGNTQMVQSVALQLLRQKAQAGEPIGLLLFDGLDDYTDSRASFVDATGAQVMRLHQLPLNPFSLRGLERKPQLHTHRAMAFADALARAYGLGALQKSTLVQSVVAAYAARGITADPLTWDLDAPTLEDVYEEYSSRPQSQRSDDLDQLMEHLSVLDLFGSDVSEDVPFYDRIRGTLILDMSGYPETLKHFALGIILETLCAQMQGSEKTVGRILQKMVFIDNADRLLSAGCPGLEDLLTQGREYGLGLLLSAQSLDVFQSPDFDYLKWIRVWVVHNLEDLRKADLEFLLEMDIHDSALERLYQASRHLRKLHSLIRISTEEPVLAEDLAFYEIVGDAAQSYLIRQVPVKDPEPLAGMPLLDSADPTALVDLDDIPAGPMGVLEDL